MARPLALFLGTLTAAASVGCEHRRVEPSERLLAQTPYGVVRADSSVVRLDGNVVRFPPLGPLDESLRAPELTVTVRRERGPGDARVLRYRSPGCGETLDLATGRATLGCPSPGERPPKLADAVVDLTLDREGRGSVSDRTRVVLGSGTVEARLDKSAPGTAPLELWADATSLHLRYFTVNRVQVEVERMAVELDQGELRLDTDREGGGLFRVGEKVTGSMSGRLSYRNGQLLMASDGHEFEAAVDPGLHTNRGVDFNVRVAVADHEVAWSEIDGRYRKAQDPSLQTRLDAVAPDPAAPRGSLSADLLRMAESAFKQVAHGIRPAGLTRELDRTSEVLRPGAELVRLRLKREPAPGESRPTIASEVTLVVLILDAEHFALGLRYPCDLEHAGFAAINGYTFAEAAVQGERLPDAGLLVSGRLIGRLRTDAWYTNLSIDDQGRPTLEAADRVFARGRVPEATRDIIQGTVYVRGKESARTFGDNDEINWRSAIGLRHEDGKLQILMAHTLVTKIGLLAGFAYGDGLTQYEMARELLSLGAEEALILDGGPSAAMSIEHVLSSGALRPTPVCISATAR